VLFGREVFGAVGQQHGNRDTPDGIFGHQLGHDLLGVDHAIVERHQQAIMHGRVAQPIGQGKQVPFDIARADLRLQLCEVDAGGLNDLDTCFFLERFEEGLGLARLVIAAEAGEDEFVARGPSRTDDIG
jgi:hypothetical protein